MSVIARQFGNPHGPLGWLVGLALARSNAEFSRWTVLQIEHHLKQPPHRIVEIGPGPGIGLEALLSRFPQAQVWGLDRSREMLRQSGRRNRTAIQSGRLSLVHGDVSALRELAPVDLVVANHVLYFWPEPAQVFTTIWENLGRGGSLALGYQLRQDMSRLVQKEFQREGFRLYDSEYAVQVLLETAGFVEITNRIRESANRVAGRLSLAATG